jgi:hypothetical protein
MDADEFSEFDDRVDMKRRQRREEEWDYTDTGNGITIPLEIMFEHGGKLLYDIAMRRMKYKQLMELETRRGGAEWIVNYNVWAGLCARDFPWSFEWAIDAQGNMSEDAKQRLDAISTEHTRKTYDGANTYWKRFYELSKRVRRMVIKSRAKDIHSPSLVRLRNYSHGQVISLFDNLQSPFPNYINIRHISIQQPIQRDASRDTVVYIVPVYDWQWHRNMQMRKSLYEGLSADESFDRVKETMGMVRVYVVGNNIVSERVSHNQILLLGAINIVLPNGMLQFEDRVFAQLGGFMLCALGIVDQKPALYVCPTFSTPVLLSVPIEACVDCQLTPTVMCSECETQFCSEACSSDHKCFL